MFLYAHTTSERKYKEYSLDVDTFQMKNGMHLKINVNFSLCIFTIFVQICYKNDKKQKLIQFNCNGVEYKRLGVIPVTSYE